MKQYRSVRNAIVDNENIQIAVVEPVNCSKKAAAEMAAYCAQQMNHKERDKQRRAQRGEVGGA